VGDIVLASGSIVLQTIHNIIASNPTFPGTDTNWKYCVGDGGMSVGLGLGSPGTSCRLVYHERCCLLHSGSDVCEGLHVNLSKPVVRQDEDR